MAAKAGPRIVNVDACRLSLGKGIGRDGERTAEHRYGARGLGFQPKPGVRGGSSLGRWPANVCLDEAAAAVLDGMTAHLKGGMSVNRNRDAAATKPAAVYGRFRCDTEDVCYGDSGGASRFFYVAKASRSERDAAASRSERVRDDGGAQHTEHVVKAWNHHPTVKPIAVMQWLVRLVTPTEGVVLDPFMGSGTTGIACVREGRSFVGIEREPEYHAIAEARIAHARGETPADAEQPALPFEARA
jgi:site-specific DNA-methyltransferase (adenine-specific)